MEILNILFGSPINMETPQTIFSVNKPKGPSSNQFLNEIRRTIGIKKVGHAGTLDPLASGVLIIGIGRDGTKQMGAFMGQEKEYVAELTLGSTSVTDDAEGPISLYIDQEKLQAFSQSLHEEKIEEILKEFIGNIIQIPPSYSAIKIDGKEAYKRVRDGEKVTMSPRTVSIRKIEIVSYAWPRLTLKVTCGSGTYIRTLARDVGEKLGTGAYLSELTRTRIGNFPIENCTTVEDLRKYFQN